MPDDGVCKVSEKDGQKDLTDVSDIEGDWWVIKGLNPHYDSFPCQHNRYRQDQNTGVWYNNVTWVDTFHGDKIIGALPSVEVT